MEVEFDKEIDAILRRAGAGEVATSRAAHLDADEISAFAENTVPDAARMRYTAHLADCTRCRKILSNTIVLNSEADAETASSTVAAPVAEAKTPWYRRLFVFPQLAYTMGAMVLLFSGFFGYLILQNLPGANNSEVSLTNRAAERSGTTANAPSAVSTTNANAVSNSSATTTNSASVPALSNSTTSTATTNSAPPSAANTTITAATPVTEEKSVAPQTNAPFIAPQATPVPDADKSLTATKNEASRDDLAKVSPAPPTAGATSRSRESTEKQKKENKDAAKSDDNETIVAEQDSRLERKPPPKSAVRQPSNAGETRSVGGKTFNNVGGIWFDSAVAKRKQKTVRRGTGDYQKLDAGLRSIADQLGGTVVVLWNGKAYRIQ